MIWTWLMTAFRSRGYLTYVEKSDGSRRMTLAWDGSASTSRQVGND